MIKINAISELQCQKNFGLGVNPKFLTLETRPSIRDVKNAAHKIICV